MFVTEKRISKLRKPRWLMVNSFSDFAASLSNFRFDVVAYLRRKNKLKSSCTRGYLFFSFLGVSKKINPTELMRAVATTSLLLRKGRRKKMKRHVGCKKICFFIFYSEKPRRNYLTKKSGEKRNGNKLHRK